MGALAYPYSAHPVLLKVPDDPTMCYPDMEGPALVPFIRNVPPRGKTPNTSCKLYGNSPSIPTSEAFKAIAP